MHGNHRAVARRFGKYRRRTDRFDPGITADDCEPVDSALAKAEVRQAIAVDLHRSRHDSQADYGPPHGEHCCGKYVQGIDLCTIRPGDGPAQCITLDHRFERLPTRRRELLGITQAGNRAIRMQDYGCRHDRAGQRAASCLIDAGDKVG